MDDEDENDVANAFVSKIQEQEDGPVTALHDALDDLAGRWAVANNTSLRDAMEHIAAFVENHPDAPVRLQSPVFMMAGRAA